MPKSYQKLAQWVQISGGEANAPNKSHVVIETFALQYPRFEHVITLCTDFDLPLIL